jgi:hypothetical protein
MYAGGTTLALAAVSVEDSLVTETLVLAVNDEDSLADVRVAVAVRVMVSA